MHLRRWPKGSLHTNNQNLSQQTIVFDHIVHKLKKIWFSFFRHVSTETDLLCCLFWLGRALYKKLTWGLGIGLKSKLSNVSTLAHNIKVNLSLKENFNHRELLQINWNWKDHFSKCFVWIFIKDCAYTSDKSHEVGFGEVFSRNFAILKVFISLERTSLCEFFVNLT